MSIKNETVLFIVNIVLLVCSASFSIYRLRGNGWGLGSILAFYVAWMGLAVCDLMHVKRGTERMKTAADGFRIAIVGNVVWVFAIANGFGVVVKIVCAVVFVFGFAACCLVALIDNYRFGKKEIRVSSEEREDGTGLLIIVSSVVFVVICCIAFLMYFARGDRWALGSTAVAYGALMGFVVCALTNEKRKMEGMKAVAGIGFMIVFMGSLVWGCVIGYGSRVVVNIVFVVVVVFGFVTCWLIAPIDNYCLAKKENRVVSVSTEPLI